MPPLRGGSPAIDLLTEARSSIASAESSASVLAMVLMSSRSVSRPKTSKRAKPRWLRRDL